VDSTRIKRNSLVATATSLVLSHSYRRDIENRSWPNIVSRFAPFDRHVRPMLWSSPAPARRPEGFIAPRLPTLGHTVPSGPQWAHEIKHDGYRFICRREGNRIRVFSRRGHDWTDRVRRIVDTFARLPATSVTLDGEGVACGPDGVTDFELLRAALDRPSKREVFLYAFDLLELDGHDLRREPWSDRRWKLARLLRGAGRGAQLSDHMEGTDGDAMLRHPAPWVSRASSPSGAIGRIGQALAPIGSRSRVQTHLPRAGDRRLMVAVVA
jgi:hypothetical protein